MGSRVLQLLKVIQPLLVVGLCFNLTRHWGEWRDLYVVLGLQLIAVSTLFNYIRGGDILMFGGDFVSKDAHPALRVWMFFVAVAIYVIMFFY